MALWPFSSRGVLIGGFVVLEFCLLARIGTALERDARKQRGTELDYVRRRVALYLDKALGRRVEFWLVLEEDDGRGLHVHGEVQA
jgi:hypothetical protein